MPRLTRTFPRGPALAALAVPCLLVPYLVALDASWRRSSLSGGSPPPVAASRSPCDRALAAWSDSAYRSLIASETPTGPAFARAADAALDAYSEGDCPLGAFLVASHRVLESAHAARRDGGLVAY